MTPFSSSRLRILTAALALAAAPALFAQGDMESDWLPNTTLFFDELLPSHAAQEEAETLADLARIFDNSILTNQFTDADIEKIFEMAAKHPDNEAFFSPLVQAAVQPAFRDKVLPRLLKLAEDNPDSRELNLTCGEMLVQFKRVDEAVPFFERAFEVVRKDPDPPSERRREYNANIASKLVLIYSDKALDKKRRENPTLADEVKEYRDKLRALRAEIASMRVFDAAPQVQSALIVSCAGDMDASDAKSPLATSVLVPFNRTAWALRDEMYRLAQTSLTCLLDRKKEVENPVFPEPFRVLCDLGYRSQVMAAALARIAQAPNDTEALFTVAILADELGDPLLGARAWDRIFAVVKAPTPDMFAVCASLQAEAKLYDDAERTYRNLGVMLDAPEAVLTKLAQLDFDRGNYKKALELLQKAPLDTERLLIETDCYMRLRNYDKALERIRNAARITPALLEGRRFRLISANIADKANNMQYVEQMLAPLLTSRPPAPPSEDVPEAEIYNSLGYIFADHDYKLNDALQYLLKAVELDPKNGAIADSYAWVLFKLKRYEEAKKEILRAIELLGDDVDATITDHAGDIFNALGDKAAACGYWEHAMKLDGDVDYDAIERKLESTQ
ncbi:MAG: tetratricopeptide repeat protein [Lentisphaeria bacterium]|nr:tetratricopeptide repeat protein [Lentisphaeria bacterium]